MQYAGGGTAKNVSRSDGLIIPDMIPGDDLSPEGIRTSATAMRTASTTMTTQSTSIDTKWTALPASFIAPDAAVLYSAMSPASVKARDFASRLTRVSAALDDFANAIEPVKKTLATIKSDAIAFTNEIGQDGLVWVNARETKAYEWDAQASYSSYGRGYGAYSSAGTTATVADPVAYLRGRGESARTSGGVVQILASWKESGHYVGRNNELLDRVADAYAKVNAAEVECANTINRERDVCVVPLVAVEAWQLKQEGDNVAKLPWGHRVDEDRNCGENFGNGIVIGAVGAVEGLGSLISYNPTKDSWGDWEHAGQSWVGVATGIGSLALSTMPLTPVLASMGVPVFSEAQNTTTEMLKGLVAWDRWSENPSEAFGQSLFNVGTMFIPVGGLVAGGVKVISGSAKAGSFIANAITKIDHVGVRISEGVANTAENITKLINKITPDVPSDLFKKPDSIDTGTGTKPHLDVDSNSGTSPLRGDSDGTGTHVPKGDSDSAGAPAPKGDTDNGAPAPKADNDNAPAPKGDNDNAPVHKGDNDHTPGSKADGTDTPPAKGDVEPENPNGPAEPNPPISDEAFSRLPGQQQLDLASIELSDGAKTFTNAEGAQYGAEHWNKYTESLPQDELKALYEYTTEPPAAPSYADFNGALRGSAPITPELQSGINAIDNALAGSPTIEDIIVKRGTGFSHWGDDPAELVGDVLTEPGYLSTSLGDAAFTKTPAVLHLRVPEGTPALYVEKVSAFAGAERELLLGRGLEFRVNRAVLDDAGKWQIFAEVITHG